MALVLHRVSCDWMCVRACACVCVGGGVRVCVCGCVCVSVCGALGSIPSLKQCSHVNAPFILCTWRVETPHVNTALLTSTRRAFEK